jgi:uncharacterized protein YbjT (DUF2867 family)
MAIALVTGGTGTLGRLVVRKLIERKYQPQKQRVGPGARNYSFAVFLSRPTRA